jgi:hypothetical protein
VKKFRSYLPLVGGLGALMINLILTNNLHPVLASDKDDGLRQPFQAELCDTASCVTGGQNTLSVPSGHRLVIEFVSGRCDISESTVFLSTKMHGTTVAHNFVPVRTVNNTEGSFSQPTRIYADPGTNVSLSGNVPFPTCVSVTLSGYLSGVD